eukprot:1991954-Amphidinium_carterae.1
MDKTAFCLTCQHPDSFESISLCVWTPVKDIKMMRMLAHPFQPPQTDVHVMLWSETKDVAPGN